MPLDKQNICSLSNKLNQKNTNKIKNKSRKIKDNKPKAIKSPLKKRLAFRLSNNLTIKPEIIKPSIEFENKYKKYLNNPTNCETDNYIIKLISAFSYVPNIKIIEQNISIQDTRFNNNNNSNNNNTINNNNINNNIKVKEKCPICIENIDKTKLAFFKCGHHMCFNCLIKFLNYNYPNCCCPICKKKNIESHITSFYNNYIKEYLFLPDIKTFYAISNINKWLFNSNINNNNSVYILISNYEKWTNSVSNYIKSNTNIENNNNNNNNNNTNNKIICLNYSDFLTKNNNKRSHNCYTSCDKIIENKIIENEIIENSSLNQNKDINYNNSLNNTLNNTLDNSINNSLNTVNNIINVYIYLVDPIIKHISTKKKILVSIQNNIKNLKEIKNSLNKPLYKIIDIKQYIIKNTIDEKIFREEVIFL